MKVALVCGAGGFIGSHIARRLKNEGYWVRGVDLKVPEFGPSAADDFVQGDLRDPAFCRRLFDRRFDEVYQLAADMGGAGYLFTGDNDAAVMHNSAMINLNMVDLAAHHVVGAIFYSSSACVYPEHNQMDPDNPNCAEDSAYPAAPDSEYGWEKLFSERLYLAYHRNAGLRVRIGRFHNVFGEEGTWTGGREKVPAAVARKVAECPDNGTIEIWGDGKQTRSFLYVEECVEAVRRFMDSDCVGPLNIGSEEMISINDLARMVIDISGKKVSIQNVPGPQGVRGRRSDNLLMRRVLGWEPRVPLRSGMEKTYRWIAEQVRQSLTVAR
jgi:nucleoside-diphosphate-sugar epimerase